MNAPIKYFGGKGTMYKNIIQYFPAQEEYNIYIEPFGGSFSIGLHKEPSPVEIYNDLEQNVYALFKVLSNKELFINFKERCDLSYYDDNLRQYYKQLLKTKLSILDRAVMFFYVNRTSHNGIGGFSINSIIRRKMSKSVSDFLSCIDRLPELHQRLSNIIVSNMDGIKLIKKYNQSNVFFYLDPPYEQSTRTSARYLVDMNRKQHEELLTVLSNIKAKVLLSGYDCKLYNYLLEVGFNKIQFEVKTIDGKRNPKTKTETLWKNY